MASGRTSRLPFAKVTFVRQRHECEEERDRGDQVDGASSPRFLSGAEARSFYESVVQSTSGAESQRSTISAQATRRTGRKTTQKSGIVSNTSLSQLSERDMNAFLKAASEGDVDSVKKHVKNGNFTGL